MAIFSKNIIRKPDEIRGISICGNRIEKTFYTTCSIVTHIAL